MSLPRITERSQISPFILVRFRIVEAGLLPPHLAIAQPYYVRIENADNGRRKVIGLSASAFERYGRALLQAMQSHRAYLIDREEQKRLPAIHQSDELTLIHNAIQNQQFAPDDAEK